MTKRALLAVLIIASAGLAVAGPSASAADGLPPTAFLAPVAGGQTLTVVHGINDPLPGEACDIGSASDHCNQQRYGLDLLPSNQADTTILAPASGTVNWVFGDCLGLATHDGLNLTVCHTTNWAKKKSDPVTSGEVLGWRQTSWIHLSLDDRRGPTTQPVPFAGVHRLEGMDYTSHGNTRDEYHGSSIMSTNGATFTALIAVHSGKAVGIAGGSTAPAASLIQVADTGAEHQRFLLQRLADGTYRIVVAHTRMVLDVREGATWRGATIIQWPWHGGTNQRWRLTLVGDGSYQITSAHSGYVLDVAAVSKADGAPVVQWTPNNGPNQHFRLTL